MSLVKIDVHSVWSTKFRQPFLPLPLRTELIKHIRSNAAGKKIEIDRLNGSDDHIHCLLRLHPTMSIADTIKLIKGESSRWINLLEQTINPFKWGGGYYARSISQWELKKIRAYIDGQNWHHFEQLTDPCLIRYLRGGSRIDPGNTDDDDPQSHSH